MCFKELSQQYVVSDQFNSLEPSTRIVYLQKINTMQAFDNVYTGICGLDVRNSTKNDYFRVANCVFKWAMGMGLLQANPLNGIRPFVVTRDLPDVYTKEEIENIWAKRTRYNRHLAGFMRVAYYTGCRASELVSLKWEDIGERFISIVGGKRREHGVVSRKLVRLPQINEVLAELDRSSVHVFTDASLANLRSRIKVMLRQMGVAYKQLRNTRSGLATEMFKKGYDSTVIMGQLGHKSITTTMRYIRPSLEEKAEMFKGV